MIIPTARTLLLFSATALPATLALAFAGLGWETVAGVVLLICAVAGIDAMRAVARLRGLRTEFPPRLNLTRNRQGILVFSIEDLGGMSRALRVGLELPEGITSPYTDCPVRLPRDGRRITVSWPVTGAARGIYDLARCHLRAPSPLGLWHCQSVAQPGTRLHVYPDLFGERKKLAALFLNRGEALIHPHRQVGQGREFEKLRLYLPGDSLGDIHWKASAKRGHLVTKEFQLERTQEVYVIIDASRLSGRRTEAANGAVGDTLLDHYLSAALILCMTAQRQGDLFGIMTFSDRVTGFVRAKAGKGHLGACREALYGLRPSPVTPDFEETATFLLSRLRRRALLLFLTSLDEPLLAEDFAHSVKVLGRRHLVLVNMLRPASARPLFSDQEVENLDDVYRGLGGHLVWHGLRELKESLKLQGVELSLCGHGNLCADMASRYINVKRRQLL